MVGTTFKLDDQLYQQLKETAAREERTASGVIRLALRRYMGESR